MQIRLSHRGAVYFALHQSNLHLLASGSLREKLALRDAYRYRSAAQSVIELAPYLNIMLRVS